MVLNDNGTPLDFTDDIVTYTADGAVLDALAVGASTTDTFTYTVSDAQGATDTATVTMTITGTNDAPTLSVDGTAAYTIRGSAVAVDSSIAISDVDSTLIASASVQITTNRQSGDTLNYATLTDITGSFDSGTGVLTLSGSATLADYEAALESITFSTTSSSTLQRTVSFQVTDSEGTTSATDTAVVNVTAAAGDPNDFDSLGTASGTSISGDSGANTLYGGVGNDMIDGNNGGDTIYGGSGNDSILGDNGTDAIYGGSGNDTIQGDNADDNIYGGHGADLLTGGVLSFSCRPTIPATRSPILHRPTRSMSAP